MTSLKVDNLTYRTTVDDLKKGYDRSRGRRSYSPRRRRSRTISYSPRKRAIMSAGDGFTLVKYKRPKRSVWKKPSGSAKWILSINFIKKCKLKLKRSRFYKELLQSLSERNSENGISSEKAIESVKFYDFVCYAIGKISKCRSSRYQFALLLLLWQHFKPSGKCYIYDPEFGSIDKQIVKHFGLTLIPRNEEAKRKVSHKTFFFVPHGGKPLYNNILWANWGTGLENVVIFGNSFAGYKERIPSHQLDLEARYIPRILPCTREDGCETFRPDDIFYDMSLHSFVGSLLRQQPLSFWNDCEEPVYKYNAWEIIRNDP